MSTKIQDLSLSERFKIDDLVVNNNDENTYANCSVGDFGMQMIQKMGWTEQTGIGRNSKNQLPKPIEFIPREGNLGLGAKQSLKTILKNKGEDKKDMKTTSGKNYNYIGEDLVEREESVKLHSQIFVAEGKHKNLTGVVVGCQEDEDFLKVEISNGQILKIDKGYVILNSLYEKMKKEVEEGDSDSSNDQSRSVSISKNSKKIKKIKKVKKQKKEKKEKKEKKDQEDKNKLKWVQPYIKVRITSKKYAGGKMYNQKVKVTDILDRYTFQVLTMDGGILDDLREKDIETTIPSIEGKVTIVGKENQGKLATLKVRDKRLNKVIVQMAESLEMYTCSQDDVCEFAG